MNWFAAELEPMLAVVVATLDEAGNLLAANAGFRSLVDANGPDPRGKPGAHFFIQPSFADLAGMPAQAKGAIYQGLLTIGDVSGQSQTLRAQVWRADRELHVLAEYDIADLERLNQIVLKINSDSADAQLALVQNNLTIKRLNAELEQHRHHLEELVASRTHDLSLALEAANAASHAKTRFLAVMSHELRTPISAMMGMTDLAIRRATDAKQIEWLEKGWAAAQHLLQLIGDVLDSSKIESGRLMLEYADFSPADVIAEVLQMHEAVAAAKGLKLVAQVAPTLPASLVGDASRLKQILFNFVSNAVKFSAHGQIIVGVSVASENSDSVQLRLEVIDQGIGLSTAQQALLFQPFSQVDASTTRRYGGIGLGLMIAKNLAQLMAGEVGVHSVPDQGSTFWATVWLTRGPVVEAAQPLPANANLSGEELLHGFAGTRVLVVEDDPFNQELAQCMLENVGLQSDIANNGLEAIERVKAGHYALVLMDVQMPVMDGLDASRAIRALPDQAKASLPIVALTANTSDEDRNKCLACGMNEFIPKPFTADLLYASLSKWLASAMLPAAHA